MPRTAEKPRPYRSTYKTARAIAELISGVGWVGVVTGGFLVLAAFFPGGLGFVLFPAGLGIAIGGFLLVGVGQFTRASIDTADNTAEMKNHLQMLNIFLDADGTRREAAKRAEEPRLQAQSAVERQRPEAEEEERMAEWLQRESERTRKEAEHKAEMERLKEEQRRKEAEEQERKAEMKREKEDKKLAKAAASLNCPNCNGRVAVKDLRSGLKYRCPHCNHVFEVNAV